MQKISIELNDYEIWIIKLALAYCKDRNKEKMQFKLDVLPKKYHKEIRNFFKAENEIIENLEIMFMDKSKELTTHGKNTSLKNK